MELGMSKSVGAFLLVFLCLMTTAAQDNPSLFAKIEQVFQEKEPGWKVERKHIRNESDPLQQDIVFRGGKVQAALSVSVWKREKDARDVFEATTNVFSRTMGTRMLRGKLPDLGDENYVWTDPNKSGHTTIKFRKGVVLAQVFAPPSVAKRFARHIIAQLWANDTSLTPVN